MPINQVLEEDLKQTVHSAIPWESLKSGRFLITGATGLVGSMLVKTLLYGNKEKNLDISVYAVVRSREKANDIYKDFLPDPALRFINVDLTIDDLAVDEPIDYIIHTAAVTKSKTMVEKPVETIQTAVFGTIKTLELARVKKVKSYVYISSMEMYGIFADSSKMTTEDDLGYINPLAVRSNYPESKRMCENICISYLSEYQVPVKIARLAQTFGAGILPDENRIFAQFARSVLEQKDIVLHTKGLSEGNYCYLSETIEGILLLLIKGETGEAYNIVNENCHTTIAQMAEMIANEIACGKIKVVFDIPQKNIYGYASDTHMKLSSEQMKNLGWQPKIDLKESYLRLIKFLKIEER